MKYQDLLTTFPTIPVIDGAQLLPFFDSDSALRVQVSRWVKSGKLIKLRNGVFLLPPRQAGVEVFPLAVPARLLSPSYLSMYTSLQYHGLVPEAVFAFTSVTSKRANTFTNPLGKFVYLHIQPALFWGYEAIIQSGQTAYVAEPEKALLDLFYFRRQSATAEYVEQLRLQNPSALSRRKLLAYAERFGHDRVKHAAELLLQCFRGIRR